MWDQAGERGRLRTEVLCVARIKQFEVRTTDPRYPWALAIHLLTSVSQHLANAYTSRESLLIIAVGNFRQLSLHKDARIPTLLGQAST